MADTTSPKSAASSKAASPKSASAAGSPPGAAAGVIAEDAPIDAEENFEDNASNLGESISTYATSISSSVANYPIEHGRRYHAYQSGRYTRPNDEQELDRLLVMHTVITEAIGGLYKAPIDKDKPQRILDIGTGTGVWAIEMGDELPNATIVGNDLSANMPLFTPPNVKFEVDDVETDWAYAEKFSYVFSRYMVVSIADWPKLVGRAFENLEPGGWAEFQDFDLVYYSEDNSFKEDDPLCEWVATSTQAARNMGRDPVPGRQLEGWFRDAGFANVVHRRYKVPIGPWARDPQLKRIGLLFYMQLNQGLEGLSMRLYTQVLNWSEEEIVVMLAKVRQSLHNPNIHPIIDYHVVYGQKPEETAE